MHGHTNIKSGDLLREIIAGNNDASRHSINCVGFVTKTLCLLYQSQPEN